MLGRYAVIDVETTGLRPSWHDRIIEVAILHVNRVGVIIDEWCTLINARLNRHFWVTEQETLVELAAALDLDRDEVTKLHTAYLDGPRVDSVV